MKLFNTILMLEGTDLIPGNHIAEISFISLLCVSPYPITDRGISITDTDSKSKMKSDLSKPPLEASPSQHFFKFLTSWIKTWLLCELATYEQH